jgi:hypothetical protein
MVVCPHLGRKLRFVEQADNHLLSAAKNEAILLEERGSYKG